MTSHRVRVALLAGATGATSTLAFAGPPVSNQTTTESFATIQAAIDDADTLNGHVIVAQAGTYVENVVLNKRLTLRGAAAGVDARGRVSGAPDDSVETVIAPASGTGLRLVTGSAASVIDGFVFLGGSRGIESTSGPINDVQIRNNHFTGQSGSAAFLNDSGRDITVHQNVILSTAASSTAFHLDTDDFDGLHFTCNHLLRSGGPASIGLFSDGNHNVGPSVARTPLISLNLAEGHGNGMNLGTRAFDGGEISDNEYRNNETGLGFGIQNSLITRNLFLSNNRGIRFTGFGGAGDPNRGAQGNTVTANQILNNTTLGIFFDTGQFPGTIGTNVLNGNFFIGNGAGARYAGSETIDMTGNWWGDGSGPFDGTGVNLADPDSCFGGTPPDLVNPGGLGDPIDDVISGTGLNYCPWLQTIATVSLASSQPCANAGATVVVTIELTGAGKGVAGGQFFLSYDETVLDFDMVVPGGGDFTLEVFEIVNEGAGEIDYAVGVPLGDPPTTTDQTMVTLTFNVLQSACATGGLVAFRAHSPPSRLTNEYGQALNASLVDLPAVTVDDTPPVLTCPPVAVQCPAGVPAAATTLAEFQGQGGSATDDCNLDAGSFAHLGDSSDGGSGCNGDPEIITREYEISDECGNTGTCEQTITVEDTMGPAITPPSDIIVNADAGGCDAAVTVPALVATDNCGGPVTIVNDFNFTDDASGVYPSGTTPVTWTATDDCGNESMVVQNVTVNPVNEVALSLAFQPTVTGGLTRCIVFELWSCPDTIPVEIVPLELTFDGTGVFNGTIEVPCGEYTCITARDPRHTLRRTLDAGDGFADTGTTYAADFQAAGKDLIGGNLNDDAFIDILDFGALIGAFGTNYGTGDTTCSTPFPHADVSGNGLADGADFTFIQINFLAVRDPNCCGAANAAWAGGGRARPVTEISLRALRRRGLGHLAVADLNRDGWLDQDDIAAFMNGARP